MPRRVRKRAHDRRGSHAYRPDCRCRLQDHDFLGRRAAHASRHLRPRGLCGKQGPAPGVRHQRHAHHARSGRPSQGVRRLRHGHQPRQPRPCQARFLPRPRGRVGRHGGRYACLPRGGPAVPDSHHGARLERARGVRHHRLRRRARCHRALHLLPHPGGARQVHQRHVAQSRGQRAPAASDHGQAGRGFHRRQAHVRSAVHARG